MQKEKSIKPGKQSDLTIKKKKKGGGNTFSDFLYPKEYPSFALKHNLAS